MPLGEENSREIERFHWGNLVSVAFSPSRYAPRRMLQKNNICRCFASLVVAQKQPWRSKWSWAFMLEMGLRKDAKKTARLARALEYIH